MIDQETQNRLDRIELDLKEFGATAGEFVKNASEQIQELASSLGKVPERVGGETLAKKPTFTCPDCNQVKPLSQMADITPICLDCFG